MKAVLMSLVLLLAGSGCSLLSVKTLEKPLSTRDMNAKVLTREYSAGFRAVVAQSADDIIATQPGSVAAENALRWKLGATRESQHAALQLAPMLGMLDTWALSVQMREFLSADGAGSALFGAQQPAALAVADRLADEAETIARQVVPPKEFGNYESFVAGYARDFPITDLRFVRASIVTLWSLVGGGEVKLINSLGTIPEATADLGQRMQIYGDTAPSQVIWQTQLALLESGYSGRDMRSALERLDRRLEDLAASADTAPELVRTAVQDVRTSMLDVVGRMNVASASLMEAFRIERIALAETVRSEREAVAGVIDVQRRALAIDAGRIADQVVKSSGEQVRLVTREFLLLFTFWSAVVLTLPFVAGYLVGRARRRPDDTVVRSG